MTNKYQETLSSMRLFETRYKSIEPQDSYDPLAVAFANCLSALEQKDRKTIIEALQAGAEGRILPKLPEKYKIFRSAIGIGLKEGLGFEYYFSDTPAEAMQNAIDKIGGAE